METTLIQTKLQAPERQVSFVKRPSLMQKLQQNPGRHLTLVSAPAGFGKTSLIAEWLDEQIIACSWLSLDEFDNDIGLFLRYFVAAIRRTFPAACPQLGRILLAPDLPTPQTLSSILINEINGLPHPILLVVDDYHTIHNQNILQLVERVLMHTKQRLHLIIISRVDPLLPLPRLRLQQEIVEIRRQDLRFSDEEAGLFLQTAVSTPLAPQIISQLNQRMEGWVAGLRLASLSLQTVAVTEQLPLDIDQDTQGYITNYLFLEVFTQQSEEIQSFLLHTAFFNRFCAELCQLLLEGTADNHHAQEHIAFLQEANLFIISLDEDGHWFRYHHLFQQMLQKQALLKLGSKTAGSLHKTAGDYFATQGSIDEALQHYLQANYLDTAVSLIEANSKNLLNSLARQRLERWMALLPEEIIWERPHLLIAKAWLFYRHWQLDALSSTLERIEVCLAASKLDITKMEKQFLLGQMHTLKSVLFACMTGDYVKSQHAAKQALNFLPETEQGAIGTAIAYVAFSQQAVGQYETAVSHLKQTLNNPAPQGPAWIQLYLCLSYLHLNAGDLLALHRAATQFLTRSEGNPVPAAPANWVSGILYYETNQLDNAHRTLTQTTKLHYVTNYLAACDSWLGLARIYQEQGKLGKAQQTLTTARTETLRLHCHDLIPVIEGVEAYQAHLEGRTSFALRWANNFQPETAPDYFILSFPPIFFWTRILVAHGHQTDLVHIQKCLTAKLHIAQNNHNIHRQIQLLNHLALVQSKLGDAESALRSLQTAVQQAEPGGFIRSFLDCGPELRPLLAELQQQGIAPHYIEQLLAEYPQDKVAPTLDELILTNRETEILQRMHAGQSNKEIANDLVISLYTVKRHASNIYRKLDVNGRRQAIRQAQQMGIIVPLPERIMDNE